jgi:cysteine desulfurase
VRTIYLDFNATTSLDPQIGEAMKSILDNVYGNPSSIHQLGRRAKVMLEDCRERVAKVWRCNPVEIVFTASGTESVNLAILGAARRFREKGRHLITSPIEHRAVLGCFDYLAKNEGFSVSFLPVTSSGLVDAQDLKKTIRSDTVLVSVMAANNETGVIQPIQEIGAVCQDYGITFHTDAVQWFGKEEVSSISQFGADLVSVCGHKFHGPKGAGALFVKSPLQLDPIIFGGNQENERRAGTENLAAISGFCDAVERFAQKPIFAKEHLLPLRQHLQQFLGCLPDVTVHGLTAHRLCNTVAFTTKGCDSLSLLAGLDLEGVCASAGSACSSGSLKPSHVLLAMGVEQSLCSSLVRFSFGRQSSMAELQIAEETLSAVVKRIRGY